MSAAAIQSDRHITTMEVKITQGGKVLASYSCGQDDLRSHARGAENVMALNALINLGATNRLSQIHVTVLEGRQCTSTGGKAGACLELRVAGRSCLTDPKFSTLFPVFGEQFVFPIDGAPCLELTLHGKSAAKTAGSGALLLDPVLEKQLVEGRVERWVSLYDGNRPAGEVRVRLEGQFVGDIQFWELDEKDRKKNLRKECQALEAEIAQRPTRVSIPICAPLRPYLGLEAEIHDLERCIKVRAVATGSPADMAGVLPGDVLQRWNGVLLETKKGAWDSHVKKSSIGSLVQLTIIRDDDAAQILNLIVGVSPKSQAPSHRPVAPVPTSKSPLKPSAQPTATAKTTTPLKPRTQNTTPSKSTVTTLKAAVSPKKTKGTKVKANI
eukprot:NODE_351_length_1748_cov_181.602707_g284_i0.p1 GENE.NODE_351_length_1748_cov_181.602707_g284_i0~~NODE_351_length_1748_cov_181.602707_g284_i0.p1  ORF type:complete len:383 (-),score=102.82 NODE_351_length_1748_cov_181.602707_g284_i0:260-1408(-)